MSNNAITIDKGNVMNDRELLTRAKHSDKKAFGELFSQYHPILFKFLYLRTRDYALTQDIVQETFVKVWQNRNKLKPNLSFIAYLYTIGLNIIRDHHKRLRTQNKNNTNLKGLYKTTVNNPEELYNQHHLATQIQRIVNTSLAQRCRLVFLLNRIEGKSVREIAQLLCISPKTVENQLHHALKILKKKLKI